MPQFSTTENMFGKEENFKNFLLGICNANILAVFFVIKLLFLKYLYSQNEGGFPVSATDNTETKMSYRLMNTTNSVAFRAKKTVPVGDYYRKILRTSNSTLAPAVHSWTITGIP